MIRIARHHQRVAVTPEVMGGKPCIRGTRIPVALILRCLGDGRSVDDILEAFPGLTVADIQAVGVASPTAVTALGPIREPATAPVDATAPLSV